MHPAGSGLFGRLSVEDGTCVKSGALFQKGYVSYGGSVTSYGSYVSIAE